MILSSEIKKIYSFFFLLVVFLIGGAIQLTGLISNTQTTLLLVVVYMTIISANSILSNSIMKLNSIYFILLQLCLIIMFSGFINHTSLSKTVGYNIYVLVPFVAYGVSRYLIKIKIENSVVKFLIFLSVVQLPIVIIQRVFYHQLSFIHNNKFSEEDAGYGTFFQSDDVALCFFLLFVINLLIYDKSNIFNINNKILIVLICSLTIFMTNSKTSKILLVMNFGYFLYIMLSTKYRTAVVVTMIGFLLFLSLNAKSHLDFAKYQFYGNLSEFSKYESKEDSGAATLPRFAPIVIFLNQPLKWIGEGPYNFYDPITKNWRYGAGHSQLFWTYNDLGILGILVTISLLFLIGYKYRYSNSSYMHSFFLVLAYSFITTTLSDVSIMFIYIFFTSISGNQSA